jgi:hypothetical protein
LSDACDLSEKFDIEETTLQGVIIQSLIVSIRKDPLQGKMLLFLSDVYTLLLYKFHSTGCLFQWVSGCLVLCFCFCVCVLDQRLNGF